MTEHLRYYVSLHRGFNLINCWTQIRRRNSFSVIVDVMRLAAAAAVAAAAATVARRCINLRDTLAISRAVRTTSLRQREMDYDTPADEMAGAQVRPPDIFLFPFIGANQRGTRFSSLEEGHSCKMPQPRLCHIFNYVCEIDGRASSSCTPGPIFSGLFQLKMHLLPQQSRTWWFRGVILPAFHSVCLSARRRSCGRNFIKFWYGEIVR